MTIQEFPLAWRWTQPSHAVLPPEVLHRIRPLTRSEAEKVCQVPVSGSASAVCHSASDSVDVRSWLRSVQPDLQASIYLSWDTDLGVETTWDIFSEFWDDFCYPSSDDVTIAPVTGDWCLLYHHYEQFDFLRRS